MDKLVENLNRKLRMWRPSAVLLLFASGAGAQWLNYKEPGVPRMTDGQPNLSARAPRTRDGKPDLSGVWHVQPTSLAEMKRLFGDNVDQIQVPGMEADTISKYAVNILLDAKPEENIMRSQAQEILKARRSMDLPSSACLPIGYPLDALVSEFTKIIQTPRLMIMMIENDSMTRQIHLDGRALPPDPLPTWFGYSTGKWDGDTLVVETIGLNDKAWLDLFGHPRSEAMRLTERFRRVDFGHLEATYMFDDQKMYTRPFSFRVMHVLQADSDVLEYICAENEKDHAHDK
jgi:hypothetical protein